MTLSKRISPQVRKEAAEWFIALCEQEVDSSGRESFDRWLRTSPQHVRAFMRVSALWDGADAFVSKKSHKVMPAWQKIAACLLLTSFIAAGALWWLSPRTATYETRAGELRTVQLPDGSTVKLNARSRIQSKFTAWERSIDLIEGEDFFSVAKDTSRPFSVRSDAARVTAIGTQFDVYRKAGGTVVTVVQGTVIMGEMVVAAGEQASAIVGTPTDVHSANVATAIAWTEGRLVFDSTPLAEVAAEFNRVGTRRLILEDNSMLNQHITGVFPANDPSTLVTFLRARFGDKSCTLQ